MNRSPQHCAPAPAVTSEDINDWRRIMELYPEGHPERKKILEQIDEALARIGKLKDGRDKNQGDGKRPG